MLAWLPYTSLTEATERLGQIAAGVDIDFFNDVGGEPDTIAEVEFLVVPYMKGPRVLDRIEEMRSLRVVQTLTAGYEEVLPRIPDGVTLANAAGLHNASTAEMALALTLGVGRHLPEYVRDAQAGVWQPRFGSALADKRVLIVGYGRIGAAVEARLRGFDVESVTRVAQSARIGTPRVHGFQDLSALLPEADVVILTAPLTDETTHLLNAETLALLPDDALVINVGRGKLIDTDALVAQTQAGRLRAGLDVTDPEPLPHDHPLWHSPGVLITPHVGGPSSAFFPRADRLMAAQLERWATGEPLLNVVH